MNRYMYIIWIKFFTFILSYSRSNYSINFIPTVYKLFYLSCFATFFNLYHCMKDFILILSYNCKFFKNFKWILFLLHFYMSCKGIFSNWNWPYMEVMYLINSTKLGYSCNYKQINYYRSSYLLEISFQLFVLYFRRSTL